MKKWLTMLIVLISTFTFSTLTEASSTIVNPNQVYTYAKMERDLLALAERYPDLIQYKVIGKSEYGRNIYAVSLGKGESTVMVNGSHHAREWLTTNLNMHMIEQYAQGYRSNRSYDNGRYNIRSILNQTTMWFVPMVNPDGVELQQSGLRSFPSKDHASLITMNNGSRDFRRWKANAKGVDLNRQYDANWRNIRGNPGRPSFSNYKGPAPHSSSETKALVQFTREIDPEMVVSYHSSGEILFWNFHQSGARYQRDLAYARQIGRMTGYSLIFAGSNPSGGGMTDWFVSEFKRPAFTPEIGRYAGPTNLPLSAFGRAWQQNRYVGLYVAQEGHKLYLNRLRDVAQREVTKAEQSASKLTDYYIIPTPDKVALTPQFEQQYNETRDAISHASSIVRQLNNNALKRNLQQRLERTVELRRRATVMMRAMSRGELLTTQRLMLEQQIERNLVDDKTVASYESIIVERNRTTEAIERIVGVGNRRVVAQAYVEPAQAQLDLVEGAISKYVILQEIEEHLSANEWEQVEPLFTKLTTITVSDSAQMATIAEQLLEKEHILREQYEAATADTEAVVTITAEARDYAIGDTIAITVTTDQVDDRLESVRLNGSEEGTITEPASGQYLIEYIVSEEDVTFLTNQELHAQLTFINKEGETIKMDQQVIFNEE